MDIRAAAGHWAATWQRAWEGSEADPIVELYAPNAVHWSAPFRRPGRGPAGVRTYVAQAFAEETEVRAWFGEPLVTDERAAVEWWATLFENGRPVSLAGVSVLRFDADGRVTEQRDYWNQAGERRPPTAGWGRGGTG